MRKDSIDIDIFCYDFFDYFLDYLLDHFFDHCFINLGDLYCHVLSQKHCILISNSTSICLEVQNVLTSESRLLESYSDVSFRTFVL